VPPLIPGIILLSRLLISVFKAALRFEYISHIRQRLTMKQEIGGQMLRKRARDSEAISPCAGGSRAPEPCMCFRCIELAMIEKG
jgi:hypothetical protein